MLPKTLVAASLKPLVLTLLKGREMYGYEIIQRVHDLSVGKIKWTANKLYPLLHDMENKGIIEAYWRKSASGPDRKYYRLTQLGETELKVEISHWLELHSLMSGLWKPVPVPT